MSDRRSALSLIFKIIGGLSAREYGAVRLCETAVGNGKSKFRHHDECFHTGGSDQS